METKEEIIETKLSKEQLQEQLDVLEASKVIIEQKKMLLEFDKEYYQETLDRKVRANERELKRVLSNIKVTKDEMENAKTEEEIINAAKDKE